MPQYDCIVVGLGGVGAASLLSAARAGWKVLGVEQFGIGHDRGSSHGHTRVIRTAYFEHPNYVPLAQRALESWKQIEAAAAKRLLTLSGLLQIGPPESAVIAGTMASVRQFELDVEELSPSEIESRFSVFKVAPEHVGLFEKNAGFLRVEHCVAAMAKLARFAGAEIASNSQVQGWRVGGDGVIHVVIDDREVTASRLILGAGAWAPGLVGSHCGPIQTVRKVQHWYQLDRIEIKAVNGFPVFLVETSDGVFYGIPEFDYLGMKIGDHTHGDVVSSPAELDRVPDEPSRQRVEAFLDKNMVFSRKRMVHESVCMYAMSVDEHFVMDHHPEAENVVFATGLSGHGFKFAPVIGDQLVAMLQGNSDPLFDFLKIGNRFENIGSPVDRVDGN